MDKITPFLWFDHQAEQAAEFYATLFPNSSVDAVQRGSDGNAFFVNFTLDGRSYMALNGGPYHKLNPAYSKMVHCDDQAEVDRLWEALSEGGEPGQCGWLVDRFGLSWQIVPRILVDLMSKGTPEQSGRVMTAVRASTKLEIAELQKAFDGP